jgi:hypothetical protein
MATSVQLSIRQSLHDEWKPSLNDENLRDKVIIIIFVAMRHRDYVYKVVCYYVLIQI